MASIFKRKNKDGSVVWRLQFRRKGIKPFIATFSTKKEAQDFAKKNEKIYCLNPDQFKYDHLLEKRKREFR